MTDDTMQPMNHLGIIVDGNRRWAKVRGLSSSEGHKRGYEVLLEMAYAAKERHIRYLSAFIFSTENWSRSQEEVDYMMLTLFMKAFKNDMKKLIDDGFRIIFLGRHNRVKQEILDIIKQAEEQSAHNTETTLALYFNYGGQAEIIDAAKHLAADAVSGKVDLAKLTDERFRDYLYHPELPDIDMVVRTSGEQRISGFALWRLAYSEMMFINKNFPDATAEDLDEVIAEYNHRQRRFGK